MLMGALAVKTATADLNQATAAQAIALVTVTKVALATSVTAVVPDPALEAKIRNGEEIADIWSDISCSVHLQSLLK